MKDKIDAIIVAAGSGTRLGYPIPKAFVPLAGKQLLSYSIDIFSSHPLIDTVIIVVPHTMNDTASNLFASQKVKIVNGGDQRWQSVRNGVLASDSQWVLVHDAARPFVTNKVIDSLLEKRLSFQCVITATPVVDTIRTFNNDITGQTIDREKLIRVGTPQLFNNDKLKNIFDKINTEDQTPTDEAMLFEKEGIPIGISWGDPNNFKVTTREDLELAEALLNYRKIQA